MNIIGHEADPQIWIPVEALSQEFNGGGFYGLEYILEDFFQGTAAKPVRTRPTVDWFGLYG